MGDVNKDNIKKALDQYEDENFVDSKETLKGEIKKKVNDYLKNKTELQNDPIDVSDEYEEETENEDD